MLRNALRNHFSPRETTSILRVSLRHRKRKPNESLVELARELRLLTTRVYPAAHGDAVDDIARDAFVDALDDVTKAKVLDADPANLEAAQCKALLVEANLKRNVHHHDSTTTHAGEGGDKHPGGYESQTFRSAPEVVPGAPAPEPSNSTIFHNTHTTT